MKTHDLDVSITKARLNYIHVNLNTGDNALPVVMAEIGLLTPDGKQVSTFTVNSAAWNATEKFDLPADALMPIAALRDLIGEIVTAKCQQKFASLPAPSRAVEADGEVL